MGDTSMLCRLSMTSTLPASWRAVISFLEQIIVKGICILDQQSAIIPSNTFYYLIRE